MGLIDTQTGRPGIVDSTGAICVQKLDDSRVAGRINFRSSLRSSSTREPSDPLLTVVFRFINCFILGNHNLSPSKEMIIDYYSQVRL